MRKYDKAWKATIFHNGKQLDLEIIGYKTVYVADVIDKTKWWSHIGTIRIKRYIKTEPECDNCQKCNMCKNIEIEFRQMCINNKWF